jgi:DNA-binding MarR family transcriptional regulator
MRKLEKKALHHQDKTTSRLTSELFRIFRFVEVLRDMKPDMELQLASIFMLIAMRQGIGQHDLRRMMDISQSSVSRNVTALTAIDRHGKPRLNFVVQRRHPTDARYTQLFLTDEGHAFMKRLLDNYRDR